MLLPALEVGWHSHAALFRRLVTDEGQIRRALWTQHWHSRAKVSGRDGMGDWAGALMWGDVPYL